MYLAFLDQRAAFDLVPRQEIWDALVTNCIPQNLIGSIKDAYQDPKCIVRLASSESRPFHFYKGVKRGDSLSPLLSITFMGAIWKVCKRRTLSVLGVDGYWMAPVLAQSLIYADDVGLVAESPERLQLVVNGWTEELQLRSMQINAANGNVMCVGCKTSGSHVMMRPLIR